MEIMNRDMTKDERFLDALDDLYIEGILAASPEELKAELLAIGEDPDTLVAIADAAFERAHAACAADACPAPTAAAPVASTPSPYGPTEDCAAWRAASAAT
jgi:hypothetical protein